MCERKTAVLISAGTELTEGIIQDTHLRFLASELTAMGFAVLRGVEVPDEYPLFRRELVRAAEEADLVILTGGLGPTTDDLTRDVVADSAGAPLEFHQEVWEGLRERFRGRAISETNRRQAMAPMGFELIPNPTGTAPGFHGAFAGALVVALPGPPSELRPMFAQSVLSLIRRRFGDPANGQLLWGTALMVPESTLEEFLRKTVREGIRWGTRVDEDRIVFSLRGGTEEGREAMLADLRSELGPIRIRHGETRPAQLLTDALLQRKETLAVAESCTGGLVAKYMTDLPGSSRVFWGGFVAYSHEAKSALLGVDRPSVENPRDTAAVEESGAMNPRSTAAAVSERTVMDMAVGALDRSRADVSIAVSGIAGPEGGTAEKPVGTVWMAVARRDGARAARFFSFTGNRDVVRRRSAVAAILFAESMTLGREFLDTRTKW